MEEHGRKLPVDGSRVRSAPAAEISGVQIEIGEAFLAWRLLLDIEGGGSALLRLTNDDVKRLQQYATEALDAQTPPWKAI